MVHERCHAEDEEYLLEQQAPLGEIVPLAKRSSGATMPYGNKDAITQNTPQL
jgi:hypothetical protein